MAQKLKLFITSCDHYTGHNLARYIVSTEWKDRFEQIVAGGTDKERMQDLERMGIKVVQYDVNKKQDLEKHLRGMNVVYVIPPHRSEKIESGRNIIDACKAVNVHCVLLWSILKADESQGHMLKQFQELEKHLQQSGIKSHCIMRVSLYMEFFLFYAQHVQRNGELPLPIGRGKFAPISVQDVNRFTSVLLSGKHREREGQNYDSDEENPWVDDVESSTFSLSVRRDRKVYCLTGSEVVDGEELVRRASEAVGARLKFKDIPQNEAERILRESQQLEQNEIKLLIEMYTMIKDNQWDEATKDYERIVGEKPTELRNFFEDHAREFKPQK